MAAIRAGGASLDLFVAPEKKKKKAQDTHTLAPGPALINGSGEMAEGGGKKKKKSMFAKNPTETLGVFHSLTILRDSPPLTHAHTHIYSPNKYGYSHRAQVNECEHFRRHISPAGWYLRK